MADGRVKVIERDYLPYSSVFTHCLFNGKTQAPLKKESRASGLSPRPVSGHVCVQESGWQYWCFIILNNFSTSVGTVRNVRLWLWSRTTSVQLVVELAATTGREIRFSALSTELPANNVLNPGDKLHD